ncbi:DUF4974 domain-containing protein [Chitinophaga sp. SYP-B3965]|uniref:FecR family protein n=1 Tax=Chitinophaga sp. SYP-B3965 TaxID=2663120 RepID=UPI001299B16F|nr:FecR family protein [Chitinophaga sp. SYP-B3965]MRG43568.1 DUF4974 domain-containing protein [Chitinophaga sp. SYP-B3965]
MQDRPFYISQLINKQLRGELSREEETVLAEWLAAAPENQALLDELHTEGRIGEELQQLRKFDLEEGRRIIEGKLKAATPRVSIFRRYRIAAAAAVLLLLATGTYMLQQRSKQNAVPVIVQDIAPGTDKAILTLADGSKVTLDSSGNQVLQQGSATVRQHGGQLLYDAHDDNITVSYNTLTTPRGGQFRITLPDGTRVWMNAVSSLRFPTAFTGKERNVEVTGEAYFEVTQDAGKPFIVQINNQTKVEVLGTHFNVNAYTDEAALETTLLEGRVRVQGTILQPGQQARVTTDGAVKVVKDVNVDQVVAWKNGAFNFEDKTLPEVMRQLARWYDVQVVYEGKIPDIVFSGEMGRGLSLSQCLTILEKMNVHFRVEGKTLVVMP